LQRNSIAFENVNSVRKAQSQLNDKERFTDVCELAILED